MLKLKVQLHLILSIIGDFIKPDLSTIQPLIMTSTYNFCGQLAACNTFTYCK